MRLLISILILCFAASGAAGCPWPTDHLSLQFADITAQAGEKDCGPASAATLLTLLGIHPPSYAAVKQADRVSLYTLQVLLQDADVDSAGYRPSWPQLEAYFTDPGAPPVIVHTDSSTEHFAVLLRVKRGHALLADPSLGLHALPTRLFKEQWTGYVLVPRVKPPGPWQTNPMHGTLRDRLEFLYTALQF